MKSLLLIGLCAVGAFASAANVETVNLGVAVIGELCTGSGGSASCKVAPGSTPGATVPVALSNCSDNTCTGTWIKNFTIEGTAYTAVVVISKDMASNALDYNYTVAIGNQNHMSLALIENTSGQLNDTTMVLGDKANSTKVAGETILPVLAVGKSFTTSPLIKSFHPNF